MWFPFFKNYKKELKKSRTIEATKTFFESNKEKMQKALQLDDVDTIKTSFFLLDNEDLNVNYNLLGNLKTMYEHNSINVFTFIVKNNIINNSIYNAYAFFLEGIFDDDYEKSISYISILFTENSKVKKNQMDFSQSFLYAAIHRNNIPLFDYLMSKNLNLNLVEIFESARLQNESFLGHLFKQKKIISNLSKEDFIELDKFDIYNKYRISSKIESF